ncbi:hypothetical protein LCGC14_0669870 [marine sediment metagenome]|uniref:Uncharacterized protein n=1 Tax=marine sediment metagenome TaxID=412755 RepID=A0A0F9TZI6_9ZZZZ
MSFNTSDYPATKWDGLGPNRADRSLNAAPDYEDWDQIVAEVLATQEQALKIEIGRWAMTDAELPAGDPADIGTIGSHVTLDFDQGTDQSSYFEGISPVGYGGQTITVDLFYVVNTTTGTVIWEVSIERMEEGLDLTSDSFDTAGSVTDTVPGTANTLGKATLTLTQTQADELAAGEAFRLRVKREATDTGSDVAMDVQLLRVHAYVASS